MRKRIRAGWCGLALLPLLTFAACDSSSESAPERDASTRDASQRDAAERPTFSDLSGEDPGELFDPDQLRTFELRLHEEDLAFLDEDPKAEEYVSGELLFEGKRVGPVGIRYKGSSGAFVGCLSGSYFPPMGKKACPKLSMKVKIDYADPEAKFYGQKKLLFHSMNADRSLLRERLAYGLFRGIGVNASRTAHVRLRINGKLSGLFLLVEEIDGRFTRSRFDDGGEGNLYKEVWPVHRDPERYLAALETNRDEAVTPDKIRAFARDLADADDSTLPSVLERWLDTDYMAKLIAVDQLVHHDDGPYHWYCQSSMARSDPWMRQRRVGSDFCGNHNYYWYEDTRRDRLWMIPWDFDGAMPSRGVGFTTLLTRWDDTTPACDKTLPAVLLSQLPATCDPLLRGVALGLRQRVYAAMQQLIDGPLSEARLSEQLDGWADQIEDVVAEASALYPREPSVLAFRTEVETLKATLARSRAEALPPPEPADAGMLDSAAPDAQAQDASTLDAAPDASRADAAHEASGADAALDAGVHADLDAGAADAALDAGAADAGRDAGVVDAQLDARVPDAATPDASSAEAAVGDASSEASDADRPDADVTDADASDT